MKQIFEDVLGNRRTGQEILVAVPPDLTWVHICPDLSVTIPYKAGFVAETEDNRYTNYHGASLAAFVKLGRQKGYRLVGYERPGYNAFSIRNDIGQDIFPEVSSSTCFDHPYATYATNGRRTKIADKEWIKV
jgi:hypothetical protein